MNNDEICKEETDFTCYGNKSPVIRKTKLLRYLFGLPERRLALQNHHL